MSLDGIESHSLLESRPKTTLTSWKEIGRHLAVSEKTAQRYENDLGMPVKRLGGRVWIDVADLEAWRHKTVAVRAWWADPRFLQASLAVCGILLIAILAGGASYYLSSRPGAPASSTVEGSLLVVKDSQARTVWTHLFESPSLTDKAEGLMKPVLADIDKDGRVETLIIWQHTKRDVEGWGLHCFSADGQILWDLTVNESVTTASGKSVSPPFVIRNFTLLDSPEGDGTRWVAAVFVNVLDTPSTLVVADSHGQIRGRYWHSGHLNQVQVFDGDGDGKKEIVVGGVRHGLEQAVLVGFDPANVAGANSMPKEHPGAIQGMGPSSEKWLGLIARSALSKATGSFNYVSDMSISKNGLQVQVYEAIQAPEGYLIYQFAPGMRVNSLTMSVAYLAGHRRVQLRQKMAELIPALEIARLVREFRMEKAR